MNATQELQLTSNANESQLLRLPAREAEGNNTTTRHN